MWPFKNKKDTKKLFPESKHIVKYAFTIGGKKYFQFDDTHNIPYERGLTCILFYRELSMNCDYSFLNAHCQAVNNLLDPNQNKGTINLYKIKGLNDQLLQRLKLPKDPELVYKLASVVFFDETENPAVYEYDHNAKKIEFWKQEGKQDFFLQKPLQELIPFVQQYEENAETYLGMMGKITTAHSEAILSHLSQKQKAELKISKEPSPVALPQT
jgi:hypothetical protein